MSSNLSPQGPFSPLESLEELEIVGNEIDEFGYGAFGDLKHLSDLNLQHNQIEQIPQNAFRGSDGKITVQEEGGKFTIDFSYNPLVRGDWLCWVDEADNDWLEWWMVGQDNFNYVRDNC